MKDIKGNNVNIGDDVAYCIKSSGRLATGTVTKIYNNDKACTVNGTPHIPKERIIKLPKNIAPTQTLSHQEMREMMIKNGHIEGIVGISMSDMIYGDIESLNDIVSVSLTGTEMLLDISYELVGIKDAQTMLIKVTGDATDILNET